MWWKGYWIFPTIVATLSLAANVDLIFTLRKQHQALMKLINQRRIVPLVRRGWVRALPAWKLVPGDVVVLQRGKAACDMVLLRGSCLVEESMLSGEVAVQSGPALLTLMPVGAACQLTWLLRPRCLATCFFDFARKCKRLVHILHTAGTVPQTTWSSRGRHNKACLDSGSLGASLVGLNDPSVLPTACIAHGQHAAACPASGRSPVCCSSTATGKTLLSECPNVFCRRCMVSHVSMTTMTSTPLAHINAVFLHSLRLCMDFCFPHLLVHGAGSAGAQVQLRARCWGEV